MLVLTVQTTRMLLERAGSRQHLRATYTPDAQALLHHYAAAAIIQLLETQHAQRTSAAPRVSTCRAQEQHETAQHLQQKESRHASLSLAIASKTLKAGFCSKQQHSTKAWF